ncbi:MAG: DUF1549 domain-containing protein [Armatimonadota bacterium]
MRTHSLSTPRPAAVARAAASALALLTLGAAGALGQAGPSAAARKFDSQVAPILARECLSCHDAASKQGGLDLSTLASAKAGGKRGPAVVPGKPEASWVWKRVSAGEMPPGKPLSAEKKKLLRDWLTAGAAWGTDPIDPFRYSSERRAGYDWWSLQPVRRPELPPVKRPAWVVNPIDRFVLARLEKAGLKPSPPADRVALIRRLYLDVLGLPPTPEEVDAFVADRAPAAYERLVDRVLASPHYGERWARHWLDVIRFGESQGFERNKLRPNAWKYRDWVVEALNSDLPYDEFVRLQLAGDLLRPDDPLAVIASGFLVMGPYDLTAYTTGTAMMRAAAREEELEGLVGTVSQTFLGLTANCARCHDHKFDPIPARDYYRLAAALGGTYHGDERESLSPGGRAEAERQRQELEKQVAGVKQRLEALPADAAPERRQLAAELGRLESRARLLAGGPAHVTVPKDPGVVHILARGDFREKREPVAPGGIASLAGLSPEWGLKQDAPEAARRKALAAWVTHPDNPLTARVMVNRVWGYHFGQGLVVTPSDFGFNGGLPSHPELLDYLASVFAAPAAADVEATERQRDRATGGVRTAATREASSATGAKLSPSLRPSVSPSQPGGLAWRLKPLHRLILTSNTYRQASRPVASALKKDAENRLLWRQNPRRLEAEAVRDAVLAISGELNPAIGGPGFRDWTSKSQGENELYTVVDKEGPEFNRRTLYRTLVRAGTNPFLDTLDCPDPSVATPRRTVTTTPLQALSLLNNVFMERSAGKWAERLEREAPGDRKAQVARAYRQAFGRAPSPEEQREGEAFAAAHGMPQLCLVLLNTNEFMYVD